jgi:hypothetical protein
MMSRTLPSFWEAYKTLDGELRQRARKAYRLWEENPFHPSLHFKCINRQESIWSARISLGCRAVGIMDEDAVTWFWIGGHDDYERFFS